MKVHHVEDYRGKSIVGKLMIRSVTHLIAISEFTKQQLIHMGASPDIITVQYNGINQKFYPEIIQDFAPFPYILYVGTEEPRKNIITLFHAFKRVLAHYPQIKLVKIGKTGFPKDQKATDMAIEELHLDDTVVLVRKFVPEDDLRKWYSNAICYVSVSKLEGFGLTIPEAMACGCPVVASDIGPFREIVGDSQIIVNPDDVDIISMAIIKYITDDQFRKDMSTIGMKRASLFDWKNSAKELSDYLCHLSQ